MKAHVGGEGAFKKPGLRPPVRPARSLGSASLGEPRPASGPRGGVLDRGQTQLLFDGAAHEYERVAQWLSWGQYLRWRDRLVEVVAPDCRRGSRVLDVATGTGAIARALGQQTAARVVGVDLTRAMLEKARAQARDDDESFAGRLVQADAVRLPLPEASFDVVTMSYLLRYVEDPQQALSRLVAHVRPGGVFGFIEFFVPPHPLWRALWRVHTRLVLPVGGRIVSPQWGQVGEFLGPSIEGFWRGRDLEALRRMMHTAGLVEVHVEEQSLGGGVVAWGRRPAAEGVD